MKRELAAVAILAGACVKPQTTRPESDWQPEPPLPDTALDVRAAAMGVFAPKEPFAVVGDDSARLSVRLDMENTDDQAITPDGVAMVPPCEGDLVFDTDILYPGNVSTFGCTVKLNPDTSSIEVTVPYTFADGSVGETHHIQNLNLDVQDCAVRVWLAEGLLKHVNSSWTPSDVPLGAGPYDPARLSNDLSSLGLPVFENLEEGPYDCVTGDELIGGAAQMQPDIFSLDGPCDMYSQESVPVQQWTLMGQYNGLSAQGLTLGEGCPVGKTPEGLDALEFVKSAWEL